MFLSNYEIIGSTDDFKTMGNSFLHKVVSILWHSEVTLSFESDKWTMRQFNNFLNNKLLGLLNPRNIFILLKFFKTVFKLSN